ncbi:hypothetical protein KC19_9G106500 [Ceratodon purpureus]|uniref:Uncharacterized protein n=1 Tax=Ceratodon purpureus TaxID=3225 RepID=A0A8T0GUC9_CERPU|nr:hypothetical protein KC19_9G106500 [Ceratodon purpureus]
MQQKKSRRRSTTLTIDSAVDSKKFTPERCSYPTSGPARGIVGPIKVIRVLEYKLLFVFMKSIPPPATLGCRIETLPRENDKEEPAGMNGLIIAASLSIVSKLVRARNQRSRLASSGILFKM